MSKISFEGIGEVAVTFLAEGKVSAGEVVSLAGDGTVKAAGQGERFFGVAVSEDKAGCAAVQTGGFAQVKCADSAVSVGYVKLTGDGDGGVKKAGTGDQGGEYAVVSASDGVITIKM